MELNNLRENIDEIDSKLVELIEKRMEVSEEIARAKISMGKKVLDKEREQEKIQKVESLATESRNRDSVGELFGKIMEVSRKRQYEVMRASGLSASDEADDRLILFCNGTDSQKWLLKTILALHKNSTSLEAGEDQVSLVHRCMTALIDESAKRGLYGNLWHTFLTLLLVSDENAYSCAEEVRNDGKDHVGSLKVIALHDMECFKRWFDLDFTEMTDRLGVPEFTALLDYSTAEAPSKVFNKRVRDRICELAIALAGCSDAGEMLFELTSFYRHFGVGKFGLHKAFRVRHIEHTGDMGTGEVLEARIQPIRNIRHVQLRDLVGYEIAKQKLVENTEAFVAGKRANNCLLYGDAGTGKSTCIKAIANEYYDRGLRIIEIYKHQFKDLEDVIAQIKDRNYKFIIYMDDLSFEEFETDYKYLKAVIEGGLEKKPENVLIYATSNRRHLIRESFKDKPAVLDDDLHRNDTVQEKLSLSNRFGVTIYFGSPEKKEFDEIVRVLGKREGIDMDEETLVAEAHKWEMSHGGLSGRTAQQFIDHLLGIADKE